MKTRMGTGHRRALGTAGRRLFAAVSLAALSAVVSPLALPTPLAAQWLSDPIPPDVDGDYGDNLAPFEADGPLMAIVSIKSQKINVFDRRGLIASSKVSTGRNGHDTPQGIFSIIQRKVEHNSNLYDDAEMPFMQRITWSGVALHQGMVPGYRASHGCIRLPDGFAERLFRTTKLGTRVLIVAQDTTPQNIEHATLPQPGDPQSPPQASSPATPPARNEPESAGPIDAAATPDDTAQVPQPAVATAADIPPVKPAPGFAELRARRIVLERELDEATNALNEAKAPVREHLVAQGKAEKALRQATALANRAERRAGILEKEFDEAETRRERDRAWSAHVEALVALVEANTREDEARELAAQKAAAASSVQDVVRKRLEARQQVLNRYRIVTRRLSPVTIFVSREAGRVFVHQATHPVMDLPIAIKDPDRPIGTHVFTALQVGDEPDTVRWVGLTLETPGGGSQPKATSKKDRGTSNASAALAGARAALDRFELPYPVLARIMPALQPGSTLIVSDLAKSIENGPGTDIIVQTKGEAAAARSIANFAARKRDDSEDDSD